MIRIFYKTEKNIWKFKDLTELQEKKCTQTNVLITA